MNTLEKIMAQKAIEVAERKALTPVKKLEQSIFFETPTVSISKYLQREDKVGIIAEFKRKSPSKGIINEYADVEQVSIGYMQAGASALSVLTDTDFFGGKSEDLTTARKFNYCPILRKDFIMDPYQIIEAKSMGADVILLIAAALEPKQTKELASFARSLGLEVLLEVHNEEELKLHPNEHVNVVGVNNRDLKTFTVSLDNSKNLADKIPSDFIKITESGLHNPEDIVMLKEYGFQGFLMGERFMKQAHPEQACAQFIQNIVDLEELAKSQEA